MPSWAWVAEDPHNNTETQLTTCLEVSDSPRPPHWPFSCHAQVHPIQHDHLHASTMTSQTNVNQAAHILQLQGEKDAMGCSWEHNNSPTMDALYLGSARRQPHAALLRQTLSLRLVANRGTE